MVVRDSPSGGVMRLSQRCDICREERVSVLEGSVYVCERCLDIDDPEADAPSII